MRGAHLALAVNNPKTMPVRRRSSSSADTNKATPSEMLWATAHAPPLVEAGDDCGNRKAADSCANPEHRPDCPRPRHDLRNGRRHRELDSTHWCTTFYTDRDLAGIRGRAFVRPAMLRADCLRQQHRAARQQNRRAPVHCRLSGEFPRFVQHAIWRFCAESGLNRCNGHRIDDRQACEQAECPVFAGCARVPLKPL